MPSKHRYSGKYSPCFERERDYDTRMDSHDHAIRGATREKFSARQEKPHPHRGRHTSEYPKDERKGRDDSLKSSRTTRVAGYSSRRSQTYGTYIWPLDDDRRYDITDPTKCRCTCCPHPSSICRDQKDRRGYPEDAYPPTSHSRHGWSQHTGSGRRSCSQQADDEGSRSRSSRETGEFVIKVVDRSNGCLRQKHGDCYPLALSSVSSVATVLSFLVPDRRYARVVVHWTDGEKEPFDEDVPMNEVKRYAAYLEVKNKKRVRWA